MYTFRSMNTEVTVTASVDEEALATQVAGTFAEAERRFSRFREGSELSALNRADRAFVASPELFDLLTRARGHVEVTGGLFDPAVGAALFALGYDRSFAPCALDRARAAQPPRAARFLDVVLEEQTRSVFRPPHVLIDLGGIAKGYTVDRAAEHLIQSGAIDAGGDAALRGSAPDGGEWLVDIEDPQDPSRTIATLAVSNAAVATSAPNRRRWRVGTGVAHHLIDPRTGAPSTSDLLQATIVAPSAELADVLAKTMFLLGAQDACHFLEQRPNVGGVLVRAAGRPLFVGALDVREVAHA
jgi:thiamine biosynthesis lipoprotein